MKKWVSDILAITGIIAVVLVFFYKTILSGLLPVPTDDLVGMYHPWRDAYAHTFTNGVPFKNFLITDPIRQQIPWRKQVIDAIKNKKFPLWDATSFSGAPLLGNIQSGALYPLNILFFLMPFQVAWTILIISQPLLAGIFLFLFLRKKHIGSISSLFGSVCFMLSGFSIAWLTWGTIGSTILWLPLILFSFEKIHEAKQKTLWRLLFLFAFVSSFFAGHLQIFFYCLVVFVAYALWTVKKIKKIKMSFMHILIPVIIIGITSPVWFRFIALYTDSSRVAGSAWMVEGFFIPLRHLVQFIAPDFFGNPATLNYWGVWNYGEMVGYIGVTGLFFACMGISLESLFWVVLVGISLVFAVDSPIARLPFMFHIPGISSLQPTRLLSLVDFGLSILAAYGLENVIHGGKKKKILIGMLVFMVLFAGVWMSVFIPKSFGVPVEQLAIVKRNLILPSAIAAVLFGMLGVFLLAKKSWNRVRFIGGCVLVVLLSFELVRFGWKFIPFTNPSYFFPETEIISELQQFTKPFRVLAIDDRLLPPNVLSFYNVESVSGYDPIHSLRYEEYIAAMERGEANIQGPFRARIITPKTLTSPLFSLLNVQYIIAMDPVANNNVRLLSEEGTTKLYKYVGSAPRVYLADQIISVPSKQEVMNELYRQSFIPGKTAVVESSIPVVSAPLQTDESVHILIYVGDRMTVETTTKNTRLLVIGNMMDVHWKVYVDGSNVNTQRVNYLFFGVFIPSGTHQIYVQYK